MEVENTGISPAYGLVASHQGTIYANNIIYNTDTEGACALTTNGGTIDIGQSTIHLGRGPGAVFCSVEGENEDKIYASDVSALSENGLGALFSGKTRMAAFTNCDIRSGGLATFVFLSPSQSATSTTNIRLVDSTLSASGSESPVFLFGGGGNIDTRVYNTRLTSSSNILASAVCYGYGDETAGGCDPFSVTFTISESRSEGDVTARFPSKLLWILDTYTSWTGAVTSAANESFLTPVDVYIDNTSTWNVTKDS